ncbi:MAG: LamG domain-containing protein [bacterium]|nr:LamG domain-containing protein [bacterium]
MKKYFLLLIILFSFAFIPAIAKAAILSKPANNLGLVGYWAMDEGNGTIAGDKSGNGSSGTLTGTPAPSWTDGKRGKALSFDGTNSYINLNNASSVIGLGTGSFSNFAWIKTSATGVRQQIMSFGSTTATYGNWFYVDTTNKVRDDVSVQAGPSSAVTVTDGNWHYVGVVNNATVVQIYVDGVASGSPSGLTPDIHSGSVVIGRSLLGYIDFYGFQGLIDDVRLYNRALSATEVAALYRAGEVTRKVANNQGLVGYWSFNEGNGTIAGDSSGNGNNGTLSGTTIPTWVDGKRGKALNFSGDDYVESINNLGISGGSPWTIEAWVKYTSANADHNNIVSIGKQGINLHIFGINTDADNTQIRTNVWGDNVANIETGFDLTAGFVQIVSAYDGTNVKIYANGNLILTKAYAFVLDDDKVWIGGKTGGYAGQYSKTVIDDVRIYNRALSATEIQALYKTTEAKVNASQNSKLTSGLVGLWSFDGPDVSGATAYDRSGSGNNGTLTGGAKTGIGKMGQALSFDGSSGYVNVPDSSSLNVATTLTLAVWVKPSAYGTPYAPFVEGGGNLNNPLTSGYFLGQLSTNIMFDVGGPPNGRYSINVSYTLLPLNTWTFVVGTFTAGGNMDLYVNGLVVGSTTNSNTSIGYEGFPVTFGALDYCCKSTGYLFSGSIDDVRIYNRALTAAEVKQLYDMGR